MTPLTTLLDALRRGEEDSARAWLAAHPDDLELRDSQGVSLVLLCFYHRQPALARWIAGRRARPLDIWEAAALGDEARLRELLTADPSLAGARASDGFAPLGLAAFFAQPASARVLIDAGAAVDEPAANAMKVTPLHSAVASGQLEIARWLLERGADANRRQQGGFTPLHAAAQNGDVALAQLLLVHGADPDLRTEAAGATAADLARSANQAEVLACLDQRRTS
jgi:ankyrin repeat protein